ncbi:MAG: Na+/H+ antiporter subunit D [Candidatus Kapabacteria bacterium]|nr:Na+/H+ antiporter subunit D [Ignavibacteriota bacterium]MCW5886193.1 Na+/H+ antiporter subunit D [Candidatus Kapabacteria bacterium]
MTLNNILILPIIMPLFFALVMLAFRNKIQAQRTINIIGSIISLVVSIIIIISINEHGTTSLNSGSWSAPFGITVVADLFSSIMVVITAIIGLTTAVYSTATIDKKHEKHFYYPLLQFLLMGVNGAFLTGDMFNLYVWYEVMLISSFVLLAMGGKQEQLEGAIKYVTLNLIASSFFLAAVGVLYGLAGTLNMAHLAIKVPMLANQDLVQLISMLFFVAFGIKSAIFPLFFWLPASYHTPPVAISAIFAGLLTKVGVYSLYRVFTLIFITNTEFTQFIILSIGGLTMLTGVLGAAAQYDFRRILSFHIISQIGYMIVGLGLNSALALTGGIFYIMHHIIVKTNLFLVSGVINEYRGSYQLKKLGGNFSKYPFIALLFLIPAMSLAGIPPLSGFWAKFMVVKASFDASDYLTAGVALFVGLLTLYSMIKIWNEVFWKPNPDESDYSHKLTFKKKAALFIPVIMLAAITLYIGFSVESIFEIAKNAANSLMDRESYIRAVLGDIR